MYDDNYGWWENDGDEDTREFYERTQRTNVSKVCRGCGRRVNIQPQYAYCNACADAIERGGEF